jgi:type VI secretion system protein ImpL
MARPAATRWYAALATLLVFVLLAWLLGAVLPLTEGERTALRVGLLALGLIAAAALLWYLRPDAPAAPVAGPGKDDALVAVAAARARLPRGAFDQRPLVLLVGTEGSCKTTVVTRAGLDTELLAGDAVGDTPPTTKAANLWMARQAVFAEPGGKVLADENRWRSVVRALRAPALGAALGRGEPAPRAAVVCVSCDLFYGDQGQQLETAAQLLRSRLTDAAREFGVALPVYVLFTKADRVPHFEAWASALTRDEIREPLGAALPFDADTGAAAAAGSHAERLAPRLDTAFREIAASLGGRRPALLARESVEERRLAAYELPRELGKLAPAATKFLVELCRPMQLGASPRLRGFYFVGARPVVVADGGAAAMPQAAMAAPAGSGATSAFVRPTAAGMTPAGVGGYAPPAARKVPQWVFLERFFPEVVLGDGGAAAAARGGLRVSRTRRALLGAGIAAMLLVAAGVTTSWLGNRALAQRTEQAARAVAALPALAVAPGTVQLPSAEALRTLDALRGTLDTIRTYEIDGPPLRLRWGLWRGGALLDAGRRVWLGGYRNQLHAAAWTALVDTLRALPAAPRPTDDYGRSYAQLKAYIIETTEPKRSTPEFLAPVLLESWQRGQTLEEGVAPLAQRQFAFYAAMLPDTTPFREPADQQLVTGTRNFLAQFTGSERIYQNMLVEASKSAPPARLADVAPTAAGVVNAPPEVVGAFTEKGWQFMDGAFKNADRFFAGEKWVVGDATAAATGDKRAVIDSLRVRYRNDYAEAWRRFLASTSVVRAGSPAASASLLGAVGGPQSPLLGAFALTARHTRVDSAMTAAFQPVQAVTPGDITDKLVSEKNQQYATALLMLQAAVEQVANMPSAGDSSSVATRRAAAQQAMMTQVAPALMAARTLAGQGVTTDPGAAQLAPTVQRLLVSPIESAEGVLRGIGATPLPRARVAAAGGGGGAPAAPAMSAKEVADLKGALNERGKALCTAVTPLLGRFPFNPQSPNDATTQEVAALLAPGTGALWQFHQDRLAGLMEKQGAQWVMKPDAPVALSGEFLQFFNRAAQVSDALFAGGPEPRLSVTARGVPSGPVKEVILAHGQQRAAFTGNTAPAQFTWPVTGQARLSVVRDVAARRDRETTLRQASGEWALFRLVAQATKVEGSDSAIRAEWGTGGGAVAMEFGFPEGMPVLKPGWLGRLGCTPQVTR